MAAASRFVKIAKEFLDDLLDNSIPEKIKRATKYGMKIFNGKFCDSYVNLCKFGQLSATISFHLFPYKIIFLQLAFANIIIAFSAQLVGWYLNN